MKQAWMLTLLLVVSAGIAIAEEDVPSVTDEQSKTQQEIDNLDGESAKIQKESAEYKAQVDKMKVELQALKDLRAEKNKKLSELGAQRDAAALEVKELEAQRMQAEADLNQAKEDEKVFKEKNQKAYEELRQRKAKLQAEVDTMKRDTADIKRTLASGNAMESEMLVTKDCKYYASPTKSPKILGSMSKGKSVTKVAEGKNWIAFPLSDSQKGYMLKACFE